MSALLVVDASVALSWVHPDQASQETDALLEEVREGQTRLLVPSLWFIEVANALLALVRRKKLTQAQRKSALMELISLSPVSDEEGARKSFSSVSDLAAAHGLSVYDAVYMEAALRRKLPLATRDASLKQAAKNNGVIVR